MVTIGRLGNGGLRGESGEGFDIGGESRRGQFDSASTDLDPVAMERLQFAGDLGVVVEEVRRLAHVPVEVGEEPGAEVRRLAAIGRVAGVADQLPRAPADGPLGAVAPADLPVRDLVRGRGGRVAEDRHEAQAVEVEAVARDLGEVEERREPVAAVGELVADLTGGQMPRPADDRRHAEAALEQAELRPAVRPGAAAAVVGPLLGRVPVVRLEDDDRLVRQARRLDRPEQPADPLVHRGDERRVEVPGVRQVGEGRQPLGLALIRIMRHVDGEVHEEGAVGDAPR